MPNILPYVKKTFNILSAQSAIAQNKSDAKNPDYFKPYGIQTFFGEQGDGKTISAIHLYQRIKSNYPKTIVVSNIVLNDLKSYHINTLVDDSNNFRLPDTFDSATDYIFYQSKSDYELINTHIKNGKLGVIVITDEYQNYFSNQDSRNVPPWVIEQNAQNRKQARLHITTSQDYDQIVKATRRRSDIAFKCKTFALPFTYGPIFSVYWAYRAKLLDFSNDGKMTGGRPLKFGCYFHTKELRNSFDTRQVVFTGDGASDVYEQRNNVSVLAPTKKPKKPKVFRLRG